MRKRSLRTILVLAIAVVAVLASTASGAYALTVKPTPTTLILQLSSPGNGWWFGQEFRNTSPVIGTYPQIWSSTWNSWWNQDVNLTSAPALSAPGTTTPVPMRYLAYSRNGSAFTSITASPVRTLSAEGVYSFDETGSLAGTSYEGSASLGIDKTRPTSSSNLVPVYDNSAKITVTATDTLSGPEGIFYSLDGAPDYDWQTYNTSMLSTGIPVVTPGWHTLSWFTIDNAGNLEYAHMASFVINPTGYVPVLGKPKVSVKKKAATFTGSVTPAATNKTVVFTVQRKSGTWKGYATYSVTVPKYAGSYSLKKSISKAGTYQVKATEGTGASVWSKSFTIK